MQRWLIIMFIGLLGVMLSITQAQESDAMPQANFYTYHQESGNRYVEGLGSFPNVITNDYEFGIAPLWLVAGNQADTDGNPSQLLTVQLDDNQIVGIDPITQEIDLGFGENLATQPIMLRADDGRWGWGANGGDNPTNPIFISELGRYASVAEDGRISLAPEFVESIPLGIQPDAKIVRSRDGRLAVYGNATDERYVHGIMGDDFEGASLFVLEINGDAIDVAERIHLDGDAVFEGLSPIWADVDGDGVDDLITTVSDSRVGSGIRVYLTIESGGFVTVDGETIGQPNRWQHQLAWGAFGVDGQMQLVEVRTPHIGGIVRFYEFDGINLSIVSQLRGYTSHVINSRNLDMAVAGDFDGDGQPEIVLPSQDRTRIAGIANTNNGAQVMWELPVGGIVNTNLAATQTPQGLILAVGRTDGTVRVWLSQN